MTDNPQIFARTEANEDVFAGIELGDQVADTINGFTGVVCGKVAYLSGCNQVLVQPSGDPNKYPESHWIDVERVRVVEKGRVKKSTRLAGHDVEPRRPTPLTQRGC